MRAAFFKFSRGRLSQSHSKRATLPPRHHCAPQLRVGGILFSGAQGRDCLLSMRAGHNNGAISGCFTHSDEMAIGRKEASNYIVNKQKLAQVSLNNYNNIITPTDLVHSVPLSQTNVAHAPYAIWQINIQNCTLIFVILKLEKSSKSGVNHRY